MEIKGIKMENGNALISNEISGKWIPADQKHINGIESLLRRIKSQSFPKKNTRECIVFEKQFNIGLGSVKSFKDEDGDFVCTYTKEAKTSPKIEINEDDEFTFEARVEDKRNRLNFWVTEPIGRKEEINKDCISKDCINKDCINKDCISKDHISKDHVSKDCISKDCISKDNLISKDRISKDRPVNKDHLTTKLSNLQCSPNKMKKKSSREVYDVSFEKYDDLIVKSPLKEKVRPPPIRQVKTTSQLKPTDDSSFCGVSFVKKAKWRPDDRMDGELLKSLLRYNRARGIETLASYFYLREKKDPEEDDEDFENLLKVVIDTKLVN